MAQYELDCIDCDFQTTVAGEFTDAVEAVGSHRDEREVTSTEHFVNIHRLA